MLRFRTLLIFSLLACGFTACGPQTYTPETAISAVHADPSGVVGRFRMTVKRVGWKDGAMYLDSAQDYRDPKTLIVAVDGATANDLLHNKPQTAEQYFMNRTIIVSGLARRVPIIWLDDDGVPTGEHYFQTQIFIGDSEDLKILP
ncbi:hypothetical protein [Gluconobacter thailandicus]|jgi:hypothetical protein|uniref:hypothetical protein n=2 Tax=Gluconobacter thailandicus TaxID=257438 RepID=UPI001CD32C44|nr:hypothetical protein [Gluconobacter thailandicus]